MTNYKEKHGPSYSDIASGAERSRPIVQEVRAMARQADEAGDDGTNDLLVSQVLRTNELQTWFIAEHLVDVPAVRADQEQRKVATK